MYSGTRKSFGIKIQRRLFCQATLQKVSIHVIKKTVEKISKVTLGSTPELGK